MKRLLFHEAYFWFQKMQLDTVFSLSKLPIANFYFVMPLSSEVITFSALILKHSSKLMHERINFLFNLMFEENDATALIEQAKLCINHFGID